MALNRIQAARLLNDREMALFESSLSEHAAQMSDKDLQAHIKRLRTQRDKYQDLWQRQHVATRERIGAKAGASGVANVRTEQKVEVFAQAIQRLEKQQQRRQGTRDTVTKPSAGRSGHVGARAERPSTGRQAATAPTRTPKPQADRGDKAPARARSARQ